MPNFDFLNADDFGKPGSRKQVDARAPRFPFWSWTITLDASNRIYCAVCLTDKALFVRSDETPSDGRATDLSRLSYEDPEVVFQQDFIRIPLASIQRFRFQVYYAWLDVIRVDGTKDTIRDFETRKTELIFDALHKRLAPGVPITAEPVRAEREIVMAVAFFLPIAITAGLLLSASLASEEGRKQMGTRHFGVMLVEAMGAPMTTLLCVAAILAGLAFIAYKVFNPRKAPTVIVRR